MNTAADAFEFLLNNVTHNKLSFQIVNVTQIQEAFAQFKNVVL